MIYKSYLIEQNFDSLRKEINLFYGENLGLINDFKLTIKDKNKNCKIIRFNEEEILKKENLLINELVNESLFEESKIIFIDQASDKLIDILEEIEKINTKKNIYLFSGILEKKSKLRSFFEKSKQYGLIPCYEDNEITIKNIITSKLKGFKNLTTLNVNLIVDNSNLNRIKLNNELNKILTYFQNKELNTEKLEKLLNTKTNDDFNKLKNEALTGNKMRTNKMLCDTILDTEREFFYLNSINQRLSKLFEINKNEPKNIEQAVNNLKPPIFWKEKANFIAQAKKWDKEKIKTMQQKTYDLELKIKSNSAINRNVLLKKLIVDICDLANA
tara:strand:+ start:802 stop:1788 length:987 start_codon:yes stop_codon:yes gene_type:complete